MITVELKDEEVQAALQRVASALTDMTPVMQDIGEAMVESTKQRFIEGEAPDGTKWAPKSQTTLDAYKARKDRVDFRPLFGPSGRLSSEINYAAGPNQVEIGSNLIYAATMQFGAQAGQFGAKIGTDKNGRRYFVSTPWGDIPARPFLGVSDEDRGTIAEIVDEWLEESTGEK